MRSRTFAMIDVGERSGQLRPYVRPATRHSPLAIMGVRVRVRHQSVWRARGTRLLTVLPEFRLQGLSHHAVKASCRISRVCTRRLPSDGEASWRSVRRGRDTTLRAVDLFARHHRPGDARHLVRQCYGHQPDGATPEDGPEPGADRAVPSICPVDHRRGAKHKQLADLPIARFGDPAKARLSAGGVLSRHQAEPGGKLPRRLEQTDIHDRRCDQRRGDRTDAGIVARRRAVSSRRACATISASKVSTPSLRSLQ